MALLFFGVPFTYIDHIRNAFFRPASIAGMKEFVVGVEKQWGEYVEKLIKEWTDFNLVVSFR